LSAGDAPESGIDAGAYCKDGEADEQAAKAAMEISPAMGVELAKQAQPIAKPIKDDSVLLGHDNESIAEALTAAATLASRAAKQTGKPVSLYPSEGQKPGHLDIEEDVAKTFLSKLDLRSRQKHFQQQHFSDVSDDSEHAYQTFFEHSMRLYYNLGTAYDQET